MPTTTMTVKLINPPAAGKSRGSIVGTDNQRIGAFGEKISLFEVGKTYEIEYAESEYNGGMLKNVRNAKEVATSPAVSQAARTVGNAFRTPKQMFVSEVLCAYIANGRCDPAKLIETMRYICNAFDATWPDQDYSQAAE